MPLPEPETTRSRRAKRTTRRVLRPVSRARARRPPRRRSAPPSPPLPWGGAGNVVAAAGCAVLALMGMRA